MEEIFRRASIRRFQDRPVEMEKAELLFRAAMAAPSAANPRPWECYAVTRRETLEALSRCCRYSSYLAAAPLGIVVCYRRNCRSLPHAPIDCSAAVENLLLEAVSLDLGAVWLGVAPVEEQMEAVRRVLSLPEELEAFAFVACGYPAEDRPRPDRYEPERVHWVD